MFRAPGYLTKRTIFQVSRPASRLSLGSTAIPRSQWRSASTNAGQTVIKRRKLGLLSGGVLLALGMTPIYSFIHADAVAPDETKTMSLGALIRTYAVYTMCSIPVLVDNSPRLLELATLPGINWIAETFVRITFFDQVCHDTNSEYRPLLNFTSL